MVNQIAMYKAPENCNRVKSIRNKFENIENNNSDNKIITKKNGARCDLRSIEKCQREFSADGRFLSRQLSDPAKRNIKRSPAFRSNHQNVPFKNVHINKGKQLHSASIIDCDSNKSKKLTESSPSDKEVAIVDKGILTKPVLIKSKSSVDFAYIRSKFDRKLEEQQTVNTRNVENQRVLSNNGSTTARNIHDLYTEPIPKSMRSLKNCDETPDIYSAKTLKIGDPLSQKTDGNVQPCLTDTLKSALKRPLPEGPAPQKPPRTFAHASLKSSPAIHKNTSFLHNCQITKEIEEEKRPFMNTPVIHDARYMLSKLENALKNKKIRTKKLSSKLEASTTSGDDSDDSAISKSKITRDLPAIPLSPNNSQNSLNLNCLNGLTICRSSSKTVGKESATLPYNSSMEEHIYAEPFRDFVCDGNKRILNNSKFDDLENKQSLHYLSTPLLCDERKHLIMDSDAMESRGNEDSEVRKKALHKQVPPENSSLSSFTSASDSAASTPGDEGHTLDSSVKIKHLINSFELKNSKSDVDRCSTNHLSAGSQRVHELKMSIQKTLESCFDGEHSKKHEDSNMSGATGSVDTIVNKFQTYVKTMPKYKKPKVNKNDCLFYCCLVVGWDTEKPQIKFKFPPGAKIPDRIEDLCYPDAASGPLDISDNAQCYSLVITNDKGERTFGYCRRVIPEGSTRCIPIAYCILSKYRAPRFYKKILTELESRHGIPDKLRDEFISEFYFQKFPAPGQSIKINLTKMFDTLTDSNDFDKSELVDSLDLTSFVHVNTSGGYGTLNTASKRHGFCSYENVIIGNSDDKICSTSPNVIVENNGNAELILTLHHDTRYEEADLKPLHTLPPNILLKIFASLLLERKVILISCVISKLSCCVDALQSILYPFSWPHTFIPILPQCLWDVVESPTPVICGVLSVSVINEHRIEDGIVVDLDEGTIMSEEGDENNILSNCMKKAWLQGIDLANTVPREDYVHSVYLSDAYVKVFVVTLKHYKNHIVGSTFEKESFIRNGKTKGIRRFLKWFTETTMFAAFMDGVLLNPDNFTLFDKKIEMYGSGDSNLILTKLLEWKK